MSGRCRRWRWHFMASTCSRSGPYSQNAPSSSSIITEKKSPYVGSFILTQLWLISFFVLSLCLLSLALFSFKLMLLLQVNLFSFWKKRSNFTYPCYENFGFRMFFFCFYLFSKGYPRVWSYLRFHELDTLNEHLGIIFHLYPFYFHFCYSA